MALVVKSAVESVKSVPAHWESYNSVKNWKKSLAQNSDSMELTNGTYWGIKTWFPRFLKSTITEECQNGLTPDELIIEARADPMIVKDRLMDAFNFCKKNQKSQNEDSQFNNTVTGIYGNVRGFYSHNLPNMPKIRTPSYRSRTVLTTDGITPLTEITTNWEGKKVVELDRKLLKKFTEKLSLRDKTILTAILSSGMDVSDITRVTVGMVKAQHEHDRIFFSNFRRKTGEILSTFWSKEATNLARQYIAETRVNAEDNEPLFVIFFKNVHAKKVSEKEIARSFRKAAKKIQKIPKGVQSPFRPKKYRKLFSDACDKAGIGENKRKIFMGKTDNSDKVYAGKARHELEIVYDTLEPFVTLEEDLSREDYLENIKNDISKSLHVEFDEKLKQRDILIEKQQNAIFSYKYNLEEKIARPTKKQLKLMLAALEE